MSSPKSSRSSEFLVGDHALFTYIRRSRKIVIPVVISQVLFRASVDIETSAPMMWTLTNYVVGSGRGGELRARPADLRPDTALERIVVALDAMDDD